MVVIFKQRITQGDTFHKMNESKIPLYPIYVEIETAFGLNFAAG